MTTSPLSRLYGDLADAYKAVDAAHLALAADERQTAAEVREHLTRAHDALGWFLRWVGAQMLAAESECS